MSQDPGVNAAILNYMARIGGNSHHSSSGEGNTAQDFPALANGTRPSEDYEWLRQAMAAVESPERKLKKMLSFVSSYNAECFEGGAKVEGPAIPSGAQQTSSRGDAPAAALPSRVEVIAEGGGGEAEGNAPSSPPPPPSQAAASGEEAETFADASEKNEYLMGVLEELSEMVEDINWATEFALMGGPAIILSFLSNICTFAATEFHQQRRRKPAGEGEEGEKTHRFNEEALAAFKPILAEVEALLCMVVAHAAQLNERLQNAFLSEKWHDILFPVLKLEAEKEGEVQRATERSACNEGQHEAPSERRPSAHVVAAALHACSSLCRDSQANTLVFLKSGGMELLTSLLRFADHPERKGDERCRPSFLSNKILARVFFFTTYLADNGFSAEELIELICRHTEVASRASTTVTSHTSASYQTTYNDDSDGEEGEDVDEATQRAAAAALLALTLKSPKVLKGKMRSLMPLRLAAWSAQVNDTEDPRRRLADELAKVS